MSKAFFLQYYASWNKAVDKYLSPVSGNNTTITLPLFSGLFAICVAANAAAPEDIPTNSPSVFASFLDVSKASSFLTLYISSTTSLLKLSGTNPAPIPCIL
jgi:hypothetical protein